MAESDVVYSVATARQAGRYFLLRRCRTKLGVLFLISIALLAVIAPVWSHYFGADWFVGMIGALLGLNLVIHATTFYSMPRAMARNIEGLKSPLGHVVVTDEMLTLHLDGNVASIPWSRIRYVWPQEEFVVLALSLFGMIHLPTKGLSLEVREEILSRATKLGA